MNAPTRWRARPERSGDKYPAWACLVLILGGGLAGWLVIAALIAVAV